MARKIQTIKVNNRIFKDTCFITPLYFLGFSKEIYRYTYKMYQLDESKFTIFSTICILCDIAKSNSTCESDIFTTYRVLRRPRSRHLAAYHKIFELGIVERKKIGLRGLSVVVTAKGVLIMQDVINQFTKLLVRKNSTYKSIDRYGHMKYLSDIIKDETVI